MAWLRIDDSFDHHPKILALGSDQRRFTWLRVLVYTCRYRSPEIPANITDSVPRATRQFLRECVELGLVDVTDEGTHEVHHWADYQAGDPKKAARQRRWRDADVDANVDGDVDGDVDATVDGDVDASRAYARARPVPVPVPEELKPAPAPVPEARTPGPANGADAGAGNQWQTEQDLQTLDPLGALPT